MKNKVLALLSVIVLMITASCKKPSTNDNTIDDKDKIDIKGSLSNGDMRNPNIVAKYFGKSLDWVLRRLRHLHDKHRRQGRFVCRLRHHRCLLWGLVAVLYGRPTLESLPPRHQQRHRRGRRMVQHVPHCSS